MRALGWPWSMARVLLFLPRSWSDRYYATIARNRYAMFGKYETCPLPDDPAIAERMVG
jgi:predicted DCC family thiol-disulfide oxidoreductase YuxK